jgi:ABC-type transporter MlaC component
LRCSRWATLGADARGAPAAEVADYMTAFEDFMLATYYSRIDAYGGQSLKVTTATERVPGDFIVGVEVIDPSDEGAPATANFRVLKESDGTFAVVDASIEGVWFGLAERDDIQGYLAQNGHDVAKLIAHLQEMTKEISGGP